MKRMLLIGLFVFRGMTAYSQEKRATTPAEYNYLVKGNYEANMPAHHLAKSSVYVVDGEYAASVWQLYRDGAAMQSGLVVIYYKNNKPLTYLCIPDIKSPVAMWNDYNKRLQNLKDPRAIQVVAFALGKFAAAE